MEKIDLTKCVNCRFRAEDDGKEVEGRIAVDGDYLRFFYDNGDMYSIHIPFYWEHGKVDYFDDLEIVPRDPEMYRDWQVGDRVHYPNGDNDIVIFRSGELVVLADDFTEENSDVTAVNTCSQLFDRRDGRLVLTDIEQQIIEERKEYEPQDGDICYAKSTSGYYAIFVYNRCGLDRKTDFYVSFDSHGVLLSSGYAIDPCCLEERRPATDKEKQLLFDAMAKEGKRWNAEKKVVEDIPKPYEFKKGEPVLVRTDEFHRWIIAAYTSKDELGFIANAGVSVIHWKFCIPYNERTMHLLGTTDDYKEE